MARKIVQYALPCDSSAEELRGQVNDLLMRGWELYGSPSVSISCGNSPILRQSYVQAVVRYEELGDE